MAGTITHEWNGTVLIVTSDSGTSACDLKGAQGEMGIRGPQGAPGEYPELILDDYALKSDIPDVTNLTTVEQVNNLIDEALGGIENGAY